MSSATVAPGRTGRAGWSVSMVPSMRYWPGPGSPLGLGRGLPVDGEAGERRGRP